MTIDGVHEIDYEKVLKTNWMDFILDVYKLPKSFCGVQIVFENYLAPIDEDEIISRLTKVIEYPKKDKIEVWM